MENIERFNRDGMEIMSNLRNVLIRKKECETAEKAAKEQLLELMEKYNVKSIDNEYLRLTYVEPSQSESLDLKTFEQAEPELYKELMDDYGKITKRKASIRITVR